MSNRSALQVANWFIENRSQYEMSNLKLQKLLYAAFGLHFAQYGEHLFYDAIEAWKYGPVVQSVYHFLSKYGKSDIQSKITLPDGSCPNLEPGDFSAIDSLQIVLDKLGHKSAIDLMLWSHESGGPWEQTYSGQGSGIKEISKIKIRRYFCGNESIRPSLQFVR